MPISSYIITSTPEDVALVQKDLLKFENLLIGEAEGCTLPVAVDSKTEQDAKDWGNRLKDLPGVESCSLVYHNFEDTLNS